jgi:hypothetical protein
VTGTATAVETDADYGGDDPAAEVKKWNTELLYAEKAFHKWAERSKKIEDRYQDKRESQLMERPERFNVFWANMQVAKPALYARTPNPVVERKHRDGDPVGRTASLILERALEATIQKDRFNQVMDAVVQDRLITSRGTAWVRFVPHFHQVKPEPMPVQPLNGVMGPDGKPSRFMLPNGQSVGPEAVQISADGSCTWCPKPFDAIAFEETVAEYVHWSDFRHNAARRWHDVWWVGRRVYMSREELTGRFDNPQVLARMKRGPIAASIPLTHDSMKELGDTDNRGAGDAYKKAEVWEIWDKHKREALWIAKDYPTATLDRLPDPLKLEDFFPCPRPLWGTLGTENLIPTPDYYEYQDQAQQLDELTARISLLAKALRVAGAYDARFPDLQNILTSPIETPLIPVSNWALLGGDGQSAGPLAQAMDFVPIDMIAKALAELVRQREVIKNDLYELSGFSDIVRGEGDARETATAQQLKGKFATLRLSQSQQDVQRFARDLVRIMGEIMCEHFQPKSLMLMSSYDLMPGASPKDFMAAVELLKQDKIRGWRIDVETDSTVAIDEEAERKGVTEYVTAISTLLPQIQIVVTEQPALAEFAFEVLKMTARRFRAGREVEAALDKGLAAIQQQAQQPKEQPPDPKMITADARAKEADAKVADTKSKIEERSKRVQIDGLATVGKLEKDKGDLERDDAEAQHDIALRTIDMAVQPVRGVDGGMRMQ